MPRDATPWTTERLNARGVRMPSGCLEWTGAKNNSGYGQIRTGGKIVYVHRLAFELATGTVLGKSMCRHSCDNPPCFESTHIMPGSQIQNMGDMVSRGRSCGKLTWDDVRAIRAVPRTDTLAVLAARYGVSIQNIWYIIQRWTWKTEPT